VRCDVLVIGGGNAALCAAISARRRGAGVILLERAELDWRGGNSKYTRNIRCAHGPVGAPDSYSEEEFATDLQSVTGSGSDPELTAIAIERSRDAPSWMEANGIRWQPALRGTLSLSRTNQFFLGGGKALVDAYFAIAERIGVKVVYGCTAEGFVFDGERCTEVIARQGELEIRLHAGAVVLASGGFEANLEWLRTQVGDRALNCMVRGTKYNDGLVLRRLLDAGAAPRGNPGAFHGIAVDARGPRFEGGIVTRVDSVPMSITVNRDALRFYDEGEDLWPKRYAMWGRLIMDQPGQIAYSIFDHKAAGQFMTTLYKPFQADTVPALAEQLGLNQAALSRTVSEYNATVQPGSFDPQVLDDCGTVGLSPPKSHWALRIDTPPYFAYPLRTGITFTYMGLRIDAGGRVMTAAGSVFENVFAAGEIMAGNILSSGYLAGFGMTIGTVFGRIAGEGAAQLVADARGLRA
jgi:tricarballylate dehydrogenase